jgi:hypothetical protein
MLAISLVQSFNLHEAGKSRRGERSNVLFFAFSAVLTLFSFISNAAGAQKVIAMSRPVTRVVSDTAVSAHKALRLLASTTHASLSRSVSKLTCSASFVPRPSAHPAGAGRHPTRTVSDMVGAGAGSGAGGSIAGTRSIQAASSMQASPGMQAAQKAEPVDTAPELEQGGGDAAAAASGDAGELRSLLIEAQQGRRTGEEEGADTGSVAEPQSVLRRRTTADTNAGK